LSRQRRRRWPAAPEKILSEAVTFGTIQIPPSGKPIVLMADRQTVGGYPKIAEVATVDLHLLAQLRPGTACDSNWCRWRRRKRCG